MSGEGTVVAWTKDDTERFLTEQPLPVDFTWPHRDPLPDGAANMQPVIPSNRIHKGYGFWLRTTPYFPGLFEEIHEVLVGWPKDAELPGDDALAEELNRRRAARGTQLEL